MLRLSRQRPVRESGLVRSKPRLTYDLLGQDHAKVGDQLSLADGVTLEFQGVYGRRSVEFPDVVTFTLTLIGTTLLRRPSVIKEAVSFAVVHQAFHRYAEVLASELDGAVSQFDAPRR